MKNFIWKYFIVNVCFYLLNIKTSYFLKVFNLNKYISLGV